MGPDVSVKSIDGKAHAGTCKGLLASAKGAEIAEAEGLYFVVNAGA